MRKDLVAGIDSSTQSCTVILVSADDGKVVASARRPHPVTTPPCSEQSPEDWWQAFLDCAAQLKEYLPRVGAISIGAQGHGLVMLDENGKSVCKAKLWNDTEAAPQARVLQEELSSSGWIALTGSAPGPALTISKLCWTAQHRREALLRCAGIMLPCDYLGFKLSGVLATERGGQSGSGYFNPFTNRFEPSLLKLVDRNLDLTDRLPEIVAPFTVIGSVKPCAGLEGLVGALVIVGTADNHSACVGMNLKPGDIGMSFGTSGTAYGIATAPVRDPDAELNGYANYGDAFLPMATTLNCAKVTDTFRRLMGLDTDTFDSLALSVEDSNGITLLPYLDGERTPNLPSATGKLVGLRSNATQAHVARAAVTGVLCNLLSGLEKLKRLGLSSEGRFIVTGGGSNSLAYRQLLADITGRTLLRPLINEGVAYGAALQALCGLEGSSQETVAARWHIGYEEIARPLKDRASILVDYMETVKHYQGVISC